MSNADRDVLLRGPPLEAAWVLASDKPAPRPFEMQLALINALTRIAQLEKQLKELKGKG